MTRQDNRDVVKALQQLTNAADHFVNRAPRVKRIEHERAALLNAITHAELVLSRFINYPPTENKNWNRLPVRNACRWLKHE